MKKLLLTLFMIPLFGYAQWTQSFEGATTLPTGWSVINGGDTNTWTIANLTGSTLLAQDGTNIATILYSATAHNDFLITPSFVVTAGVSDRFSFWARSRDVNYPEVISVKLSNTTATAPAFTATLAASIAPVSGTSFYKYTLDLTAYVGQTVYVGFLSTTTDRFAFDIDNVAVGTVQTCFEPSALAYTAVTNSTTTLSWTAPTEAPASGYQYYVSSSSVTPAATATPTGSVGAGVTSATITLAGGTNYVWVRGKCSDTSFSPWSSAVAIAAPFEPANVPYAYGFESNQGWSAANAGTGNNWAISTITGDPSEDAISAAAEGISYASYSFSETSAANAWLFSRRINMVAGQVYNVSFKYRIADGLPYSENLKVTIGNTNTVVAQTTTLFDASDIVVQEWTTASGLFTCPTTGTYVVGFNCYSAADKNQLGVDDVLVSASLAIGDVSSSDFSIYPNPTSSVINISNSSNIEINSVIVADLNGRTIKTIKVNNVANTQINLSDVSTGIYLMTINSDKGSITKKIVRD